MFLFRAERDVKFPDSERVTGWNKSFHFRSQTCDEPSVAEPFRRLPRHPRNALLIIQCGAGNVEVIIADIKGKCNREMKKWTKCGRNVKGKTKMRMEMKTIVCKGGNRIWADKKQRDGHRDISIWLKKRSDGGSQTWTWTMMMYPCFYLGRANA